MAGGKKVYPNPWHPDFRIKESLPDVKSIRTEFMLNLVAGAICLFTGILLLLNWMEANQLKNEIASVESFLEMKKRDNELLLGLSGDYRKHAGLLEDYVYFAEPYLDPVKAILSVVDLRPEPVEYDRIVFEEKMPAVSFRDKKKQKPSDRYHQLTLDGRIVGSYDEALETLGDFVKAYKGLEAMASVLEDVEMTSLERSEAEDQFDFRVVIQYKVKEA